MIIWCGKCGLKFTSVQALLSHSCDSHRQTGK